jgi:hypothetical protein
MTGLRPKTQVTAILMGGLGVVLLICVLGLAPVAQGT